MNTIKKIISKSARKMDLYPAMQARNQIWFG